MSPMFLPALKGYASLSLYNKNNKGASMGHDRGGCGRENYSGFPKLKPETRKEMFKTEPKKFTEQDS